MLRKSETNNDIMETLTNGVLTIEVSSHGAELCSIRKGGTEYLWQADPAFWKRHSPVLFPIVGSLWNGKYRVGDKEYEMSQHGFARDMDFTLVSKSDNEIWYRLKSCGETLARYPYPFVLEIGYRLDGNRVEVLWKVSNPSDSDMYFQIGAHPAFYYPDFDPQAEDRGYFLLERQASAHSERQEGRSSVGTDKDIHDGDIFLYDLISEKGCADPDTKYEIPARIPLDTHTFDRDALIFEDSQVGKVTLLTKDGTPWLALSFDAPLVGLWSPVGKNAPFVCIEPWYGRCDRAGFEGDFSQKDRIQHLGPHRSFNSVYTIEIY